MEEKEIRRMCLDLLERGWPAYLTTVDKNGYPQTRAMFNLRNSERYPKLIPIFAKQHNDFTIIFSTNTSSTKIEDIKSRPKVSVYFCRPEETKGVMFGGDVEIVDDTELKKALWHENWVRYYPQGYDDPDHTVLRLVPTVVKGWTGSQTFRYELGD
ncbi:MAG: pyridoxamine 5'-phosphate oxidase family protein [Candidatus Thorarchaeota archaeon]